MINIEIQLENLNQLLFIYIKSTYKKEKLRVIQLFEV